MVINDCKNDVEYLQDRIDYLNNLFESYTKKKLVMKLKQLDICLKMMKIKICI